MSRIGEESGQSESISEIRVQMNRLRLAQEGYGRLASALGTAVDEQKSDQAEAWLQNDVCPVVDELTHSRNFRLTTRWSLDHLGKGVSTDERRLVESVDQSLIRCARVLLAAASNDAVAAGAGAGGSVPLSISPKDYAALTLIANRPWLDLVCVDDFFYPRDSLELREAAAEHTTAFRSRQELRVPLGDYVLRSALARIGYWQSLLDRIWNDAFHGESARDLSNARRAEVFDAKIRLNQAVAPLRCPKASVGSRTDSRPWKCRQ